MEYRRHGVDLRTKLLDQLAVSCCCLVFEEMCCTSGKGTTVDVPNAAEWLRGRFHPSEYEPMIVALAKHVDPADPSAISLG
jgi:hypothetical protein